MAFHKVSYSGKEQQRIATVQPIRSKRDIKRIRQWFVLNGFEKYEMIFMLGCYTGLRVGDLVSFKVKDFYENGKMKKEVVLREEKTGKVKIFPVNENIRIKLIDYCKGRNPEEYIFDGRSKYSPLDRSMVYRLIVKACNELGIEQNVGTHTMRKTFGYHHYKQFHDIAVLQEIFNHASPDVTKRYIGITQDEVNTTYLAYDLEKDEESLEDLAKRGNNRTRIKAVLSFISLYIKQTAGKGIHVPFAEIIIDLITNTKAYTDVTQVRTKKP